MTIFPFIFIVLITAFEFLVAGLQAYIFTTLICIYLSDIYAHH
jgi:F-type H+-transporting ATPase subunit a